MSELGSGRGKATACIFRHAERKIPLAVHGDDFLSAAAASELGPFHVRPVSLEDVFCSNPADLQEGVCGNLAEAKMPHAEGLFESMLAFLRLFWSLRFGIITL